MYYKTPLHRMALLICLIPVWLATGCGQEDRPTDSTPTSSERNLAAVVRGGVYRVPLVKNPSGLDPARLTDEYSLSVANQIFEGLVRFGPFLSIKPAIAENWVVKDNGRHIIFHIRPNVQFHHGRPVVAKDVIFSLERLLRVDPAPAILPHLLKIEGAQAFRDRRLATVSGLRHLNAQTVSMTLVEPYAPILNALAMYQAAIVPEDKVRQNEGEFSRAPVGSGPFQFLAWDRERAIQLERNPEYYDGPSHLDRIEYHIYDGSQLDRVFADFLDGKLEEMPVYGSVRQQLMQMERYQRVQRPSLSLLYYGINLRDRRLKEPQFRRALSLALDRKMLVETVYKGQFEPAFSVLPPGMPAYNRQEQVVKENTKEAQALVQQVFDATPGPPPAVEIVSTSQSAFAQAEFRFIRDAWARIGVDAKIKYITDWSEFESYLKSEAVQLYRYVWTADMPDPDNFLQPLFGSDSPVNFSGLKDPAVDRLLKEANGIGDPVQRAQKYQHIEKQVMQIHPIIPLFYLSVDRVYQPNVNGIYGSALGAHAVRLHGVWLSSPKR